MKFEGSHDSLEKPVKSSSFLELQLFLEAAGGYNRDFDESTFKHYETAWINKRNYLGRKTAQYYFSMKERQWKKSAIRITTLYSWEGAKEPFATIALWILKKTKIDEN